MDNVIQAQLYLNRIGQLLLLITAVYIDSQNLQ